MHIISASRRTDIPAFYMPWMIKRLRAGEATYPNPFNKQQHTVSLRPDDVHSIVFWSKYYQPFLPHIDELEERSYRFYCHYTITATPRQLEPHVPRWPDAVRVFHQLAARTSPRHVQWRFDPILLTHDLDAAFYIERFRQLADALDGATTRCYFSFATFYGKVERRLQAQRIAYTDPLLAEKRAIVAALVDIAAGHNITLHACCQAALLGEGVHQAHCVDGDLLAALFPVRPPITRHTPTRDGCGCVASRDIGMYDTCPYGCVYCYANQNQARALARRQAHDPAHTMLVPPSHTS
jgi:hypothetical protein